MSQNPSTVQFSSIELPNGYHHPYIVNNSTIPSNIELPQVSYTVPPQVSSYGLTLPQINNVKPQPTLKEEYQDVLLHCLFDKVDEMDITSKETLNFLLHLTTFPRTEENKNILEIVSLYNRAINKIIMQVVNVLYNSKDPQDAYASLGKWISINNNVRDYTDKAEHMIRYFNRGF